MMSMLKQTAPVPALVESPALPPNEGTWAIPFCPVREQEQSASGFTSTCFMQNIAAMDCYQDKSAEELRHQDYSAGVKAGWQAAFVRPMAASTIIANVFRASASTAATSGVPVAPTGTAAAAAPAVPTVAAGAGPGVSATPETTAGLQFGSPWVQQTRPFIPAAAASGGSRAVPYHITRMEDSQGIMLSSTALVSSGPFRYGMHICAMPQYEDMSPEELRHQDYGIGALALDLAAVFSCSAAFRKGSTTTAPAAAATPAPTTSGTSAAATAAVASAVAAAATAAGAAASAVAALSTLVGDAAASAMPVAGFTGAVGQGQQVPAAEGGHARLQVLQQELRALSLKAAAAADAASNSLKQPGLQQQHQQQQSGFGSHHGASTVATGSTPSAPATGVPPGWPPFGTVVPAVCVRAAGPANGTTAPQPPPAAPQEVPRPPTSHVQTAGAAQQQGNHQQQRNQQARAAGAAPAAAGQQGGYAGAGQGQHARRRRRRRGAGRLEV